MAIKRNEIKVHFEKVMILCIRTIYRSARYHPFVFSLVLFMLVLYRSFPCLFAFLASSSPVIVCTTLLLGLLLSYGEPNIPEIEEDNKSTWEVSSMEIDSPTNHLYMKEDGNLSVENHVENRNLSEEIELKEKIQHEKEAIADVYIYQATEQYEGNKIDTIMKKIKSGEKVKNESNNEDEVIQHEEYQGQAISKDRDLCVGEIGGITQVTENAIFFYTADKQETEDHKLEMAEAALDHHFGSSLGLPQRSVDHHSDSDTESDRAESSSPDASMADIIPMLDELETLLNSEHPQHVSISKSDADSEMSSDHETNDNSIDEEEEKDGEEKDGEAQEERDDGTEAAVKWTEDDQKNVMDLGSSELERNQRLESLIAKRRARKNLTFRLERNLIDFDADDSFLSMGELSRFRVQVPPRRNPFDSPYDSEEILDLPPIPGSAPSSLLPRRNPFDIFYDQQEQDSSLTGETWGHQDFVSAPHRETPFRRNETFSSARRELQQERHPSRLKPYFVAEKMDWEERSSTFQRQFSDRSESKVSTIPESDTISSATDQEYKRELEEQEVLLENKLPSPGKHDADAVDSESHTSEEVEPIHTEEEKTEHLTNDHDSHLDINSIQERDQVIENFGAVEEDTREEMHRNLSISDSEKFEVIEPKHDEPDPSSSNLGFKASVLEQSSNMEQTIILGESDYLTRVGHKFAEPVHDSSLPADGKFVSEQSTLDEALLDAGESGNADSSVEFDMEREASKIASSPRTLEVKATSGTGYLISADETVEELVSVSIGPVTSFQSCLSIDEKISRSREINDSSEYDDVKIGKSVVQEESSHLISCMTQEPATADNANQTRAFNPNHLDVSNGKEGEEIVETSSSSCLDVLLVSAGSIVYEFQQASPSMEKHSSPSDGTDIVETHSTLDLPSNSEENQEDFKQKEDHPSCMNYDQVVGLTGLQMNEDVRVLGSDIEQDAPFFPNPRQEVDNMDDNRELFHKPKDSTSDTFPSFPIQDGGLTGLQLIKLTQSKDSEMMSDIPVHPIDDLSESGDAIKNSLLTKHAVGSVKMVDSSDEESEEIHPLVLEAGEIDESLPIDMDGDVDFHIQELSSNQQGLDLIFQKDGQSEDNASTSRSQFHEVHSGINQHSIVESDVWSSFDSNGNSEQTVYNPKFRVLEASMVEEVDSGSNQLLEKATTSTVPETDLHNPTTAELVLESSEIYTSQINMNPIKTDSELLVVEARSVEDIHSAFKQISQTSLDKPLCDEVGSQNSPVSAVLDAKQIQSDLHVVEAKSIEDIDKAFSQLSHSTGKKAPEVMESEVLEVHSPDISLVLKEPFASETSSSMEIFGEKSEAEKAADKEQEKENFRNSISSSSSSSSSSDSDVSKK
ncbi:hypothetical protein Cni_G05480 [Canna indica]|uniref:Uncharacterized protein n=1 Tax=Canna indica TaxID=4628 RepID=A0AAQ3Q3T1_9LILI|nr:hypothetical protein Cni_G05480 [Canna indica]